MSGCGCGVCAALDGMEVLTDDQLPDVVQAIPDDVQEILAAYARIVENRARPGDRERVQRAAACCGADRFGRAT